MFEDLTKALERMKSVSVPIESDEKGYIDKQCPSEECEFLFKVNEEDWTYIFKDEAVWCPLCKHEAPADQWFTLAQVEHSKFEALAVVEGTIHNALLSGAQKFNRGQSKNKFISMSMKVQGGRKRTHAIPAKAAEEMQLEVQCEKCTFRFAVIGSAFFCPACGHNSVTQTYLDFLRKIRAKMNNAEIIREALIDTAGKDEAELICRSLKETCISDGVVAFQIYCSGLYAKFGTESSTAFQRLEQGSNIWKESIQMGYEDWLNSNEMKSLNILFQKRHLLAHSDGIVDSKYITKSGDESYQVGQRIVVTDRDIDCLIKCLEALGQGLKNACDAA